MKKIAVLVIVLLESGCATAPPVTYWANSNPAVVQDQFLKDRYACLLETQKPISAASVGQYGGSAESKVMPPCSAFNACLLARGYSKVAQGNLSVTPETKIMCSG